VRDWQADIRLLRRRTQAARAILGVSDDAGPEEIRTAFRRTSLACHPDCHPDDEDAPRRFHLACCAYRCLTEGECCDQIDGVAGPHEAPEGDGPRMDGPWGYWCWWRDKYFDGST
jgi:DnaJ-class molecular chaperone